MTTPHTPGPWDVEDPMGAEIGLSIVQSGLKTYEWSFIAMVCQDDADDPDRILQARFISPAEQEANAKLIAAAPELLDALKAMLDPEYTAVAAIGLAEAAVAKATS